MLRARPVAKGERSGDQQRQHQERVKRESWIHGEQHHEHSATGEDADHRGQEPLLDELGERLDVGGHACHDPSAEFAVEVVEREALEVGEGPRAQREQQPLGRAGSLKLHGTRVDEAHELDHREGEHRNPESSRCLRHYRQVDAAATNQKRRGERRSGVDQHQK